MAILGVNGTTNGLWLAVVSDEGAVVNAPASITVADDQPLDVQLANAVAEARRLIETHSIAAVSILDAETTGRLQLSFAQLVPRISLEAAVMLAAHHSHVPVARRSRAWVRATLDLPRGGALSTHVPGIIDPHPPHWTNQRDLAALVAIAERAS